MGTIFSWPTDSIGLVMSENSKATLLYSEIRKAVRFHRDTETRYSFLAAGINLLVIFVGGLLTALDAAAPHRHLWYLLLGALVVGLNAFFLKRIAEENTLYQSHAEAARAALDQLVAYDDSDVVDLTADMKSIDNDDTPNRLSRFMVLGSGAVAVGAIILFAYIENLV